MMFNTRYISLLLTLCCGLAWACNKKTKDANQKKENMTQTNPRNESGQARPTDIDEIYGVWTVRSVTTKGDKRMDAPQYYHLYIDEKGIRLPLDVNVCNAGYSVERSHLIIEGMSCTEACCDKEAGQTIANFLSGSIKFRKDDRELFLTSEKGNMELFQPMTILPNTRWKAISYHPNGEKTKAVLFSKPYILDLKDMHLGLELDANQCMTNYSYTDKTIKIPDPFGCSKVCCDSKDGLLLRDMLQGRINYTVDGNNLTLTTDKYIIQFLIDNSPSKD